MHTTENNLLVIHSRLSAADFRGISFYNGLIRGHRLLKVLIFALLLILFGWCHFMAGMPKFAAIYAFIGFIIPFVYVLQYWYSVHRQTMAMELSETPQDAYTVGFTQRGIWIQRGQEHASVDWNCIDSAYARGKETYLYYMQNRALILPDASTDSESVSLLLSLLEKNLGHHFENHHTK